jgi:hypothetical protein
MTARREPSSPAFTRNTEPMDKTARMSFVSTYSCWPLVSAAVTMMSPVFRSI